MYLVSIFFVSKFLLGLQLLGLVPFLVNITTVPDLCVAQLFLLKQGYFQLDL